MTKLSAADTAQPRPKAWKLSPQSVVRFVLGDDKLGIAAKLARQISLFGRSAVGMPPPWVYEGADGVLVLYNSVTRATRIAKLAPGTVLTALSQPVPSGNRL